MSAGTARLEGTETLVRRLETLDARAQTAVTAALRQGAKTIVAAAQTGIHDRTGSLRLAYGSVVRRRRQGGAYAVIGARRGQGLVEGVEPANYDHLAESGARAHVIPIRVRRRGRVTGEVREIRHPGATARPHLRPAMESQGPAALETVRSKLADAVREAERI